MSPTPLVSILTPCYNQARFLDTYFQGVLAQTYPNWEIVIIDDGSTDESWTIIQKYARHDSRIKTLRQPNLGMWRFVETHQKMLAASSGELIAILDADDYWLPEKLEVQVPLHLEKGYPLSFAQVRRIDATGDFADDQLFPRLDPQYSFELFVQFLRGEYTIPSPTIMISREALQEIGGFQQPPYLPVIDFPTCLVLGGLAQGFTFIPQVLGHYRISKGQSTWRLAREMAQGAYRLSREFLQQNPISGLSLSDLLSPARKSYLADSSYRAAALAWESGARTEAMQYVREIAGFGKSDMFVRALVMFAYKSLKPRAV